MDNSFLRPYRGSYSVKHVRAEAFLFEVFASFKKLIQ